MSIGERIFKERTRLGLSQAAFAKAAGISLSSQKRYEKGEREPDTAYLDAIKKMGVDLGYVFSGLPKEESARLRLADALGDWGRAFATVLGISDEELIEAGKAVNDRLNPFFEKYEEVPSHRMPKDEMDSAVRSEFLKSAYPLVEHSPKFLSSGRQQVDAVLLASVLSEVDSVIAKKRDSLSPERRAKVTAMLYRAFIKTGEVDLAMVEDAVMIACQD